MNGMERKKYHPMTLKYSIITAIKGALIGIANIIPGVSGGTFALILGIYERLLDALHAINPTIILEAIRAIVSLHRPAGRRRAKEIIDTLDLIFLSSLGLGALTTILGLSFLIDYLLVHHPGLTLSFFIGLIIPSIVVPWKMMGASKRLSQLSWMIPGIALTIGVAFAFGNIESNDSLIWSFLTGVIAVSAMILPGISGSFVMLVMGQYQNVLRKLQLIQTTIDLSAWIWLFVFGAGCIVGLLLFARFLGYLLAHRRNATLAFLIGLILGSFWILWPFKQFDYSMDLNHIAEEFRDRVAEKQDIRIATAPNQMPADVNECLFNLLALSAGLAGALGLNRFGSEDAGVSPFSH
ncbi:DUF368 domain-containing protein [bacterium]|nr:DUF368 domain-containing protein [candidate division CSSED10-310 bacterium]